MAWHAVSIDLVSAPANTPLLVWLSFASAPQAFFGGTIHATPFSLQVLAGSDAAGHFSANTTWPTGVPSGTDVWFQCVLSDPSVRWDLTVSNGLRATTP